MSELNYGLTSSQVKQSRNKSGSNQITVALGLSFWHQCMKAFLSFNQLFLVLAIGCNIYYQIAPMYMTYALGAVYMIRVLLTFYYARRKAIQLKDLLNQEVQVIRDGTSKNIKASELVVGDMIYITQNHLVGADGIIKETKQVAFNESIYNHKNRVVTKNVGDLVYLGSSVLFGSALVEVTSVGKQTVLGKCIKNNYEPLKVNKTFKKAIALIYLFLVILMAGMIIYALGDLSQLSLEALKDWMNPIFGVICILGLHPAFLMMDYFGYYENKQLIKNNIKQTSDQMIDELSQVDLLILDKKESFTKKELEVVQSYADDQDLIGLGLGLYAKDHIDQYQHAFASFASEKKFNIDALMENMNLIQSSTNKSFDHIVSNLYVADRGYILYSIGSVDDLLDVSKYLYIDEKEVFFGAKEREAIGKKYAAMKQLGQEVYGIAYQVRKQTIHNMDDLQELCFIGLVGLQYPLKDGCLEGLRQLRKDKVRVMITSDERSDLVTIAAKEAHIIESEEEVLTGRMLETMTERRLLSDLDRYKVFTDLNGNQKERIVSALKKNHAKIAVSVRSIEELLSIHSADVLLTKKDNSSIVISELGNIRIQNLDFNTIIDAIRISKKHLQRFYKMMNYAITSLVGLLFVYFFSFISNLLFHKPIVLFDPYVLVVFMILLTSMIMLVSKYDSKKNNRNTSNKVVLAGIVEGIIFGIISVGIYLGSWYFNHPSSFFEVSMILLVIFTSYVYDNHMKNTYSFHFYPFIIKGLWIAGMVYYYGYVLQLSIDSPIDGIYIALPIMMLLMVSVVKKIIYRKENRHERNRNKD